MSYTMRQIFSGLLLVAGTAIGTVALHDVINQSQTSSPGSEQRVPVQVKAEQELPPEVNERARELKAEIEREIELRRKITNELERICQLQQDLRRKLERERNAPSRR